MWRNCSTALIFYAQKKTEGHAVWEYAFLVSINLGVSWYAGAFRLTSWQSGFGSVELNAYTHTEKGIGSCPNWLYHGNCWEWKECEKKIPFGMSRRVRKQNKTKNTRRFNHDVDSLPTFYPAFSCYAVCFQYFTKDNSNHLWADGMWK